METGSNALVIDHLGESFIVHYGTIVFCEADGSYTNVHCEGGTKHIICKNLGGVEQALPGDLFFRCNDSCIVNLQKVRKVIHVDGHQAELTTGKRVPVARRRAQAFKAALRGGGG